MDLYQREIVGWYADKQMTKALVLKALDRAYDKKKPKGKVLHHSDRGSQYASKDYGSMSRKGNCYDNACIESFHSIIKKELIYLNKFKTREEAKKHIYEYIEFFYNRKRIHSSIGYFTPLQYERMYYNSIKNAA